MTAVLASCLVWVLVNCAWSQDTTCDESSSARAAWTPPLALQRCASTASSILVGTGVAGLVVPLVGAGGLEGTAMLLDLLACKTGVVGWSWLQQVAITPRGQAIRAGALTCALLCTAAVLAVASALTA